MFPLTITNYVKMGLAVLVVLGSAYIGYRIGHGELVSYKLDQQAAAQKLEAQYQAQAAQIEKEKNDQITAINSQLADTLVQLQQRPSRPTKTSTATGGTGATLYAQDAEFLVREAARADEIRIGLQACYAQYDSLK